MRAETPEEKAKDGNFMKFFNTLFAVCLLTFSTTVNAQTIGPDSMLPQQQPEVQEQAPELEWQPMPRTIVCQSIGFVRQYLQVRGLREWAMAQTAIGNPDPFNGAIIVRNPTNKDFAIVLVQTTSNMACIVMIGGQLLTMEEIQQIPQ